MPTNSPFYTNIASNLQNNTFRGEVADWNYIPDIPKESLDTAKQSQDLEMDFEREARDRLNARNQFEKNLFKQMGANPFLLSERKAIQDFERSGGVKELFKKAFQGELSWRDRRHMSPEQRQWWNKVLLKHRANISADVNAHKQELRQQYEWAMSKYDQNEKTMYQAYKSKMTALLQKRRAEEQAKKEEERARKYEEKELRIEGRSKRKELEGAQRRYAKLTQHYSPTDKDFVKYDKEGRPQRVPQTEAQLEEINRIGAMIGKPPIEMQQMEVDRPWYKGGDTTRPAYVRGESSTKTDANVGDMSNREIAEKVLSLSQSGEEDPAFKEQLFKLPDYVKKDIVAEIKLITEGTQHQVTEDAGISDEEKAVLEVITEDQLRAVSRGRGANVLNDVVSKTGLDVSVVRRVIKKLQKERKQSRAGASGSY